MQLRFGLFASFMASSLPLVFSENVFPLVGSAKFEVGTTSIPLTDLGRPDPFAQNDTARSIMASGFYPVAGCHKKHNVSYMPPATAAFQDTKFAAYELPNGTFKSLSLETCEDVPKPNSCGTGSLPVLLFSGALGTSRLLYSSMLQSIAAAGYYVISVDHPYDADIVEFPDGKVITAANISSNADVELAVKTRVQDISFVHTQLANTSLTNKLLPGYKHRQNGGGVAVFGHSLGGAAAAASMLQINSLRGGLNIDGTMFGFVVQQGLKLPFMLIGHENKTRETDPSWDAIWPKLKGWRREFEVLETAHYSFSDLPLMLSVLGLPEQIRLQPAVTSVLGSLEGHRVMGIVVTYATAFFDFVLKTGREGILKGGNDKFPEVLVVE